MKTKKVLLGALAGLAAGALLGVLFAPEKGSDIRKNIFKKGKRYAGALKEEFDEIVGNINEKIEKVKDEVSQFTEKHNQKT